jgi:hypothetical protein
MACSGSFFSYQLSTISASIKDLSNLVVLSQHPSSVTAVRALKNPSTDAAKRTFGRIHTAPASSSSNVPLVPSRAVVRADSVAELPLSPPSEQMKLPRHEIHLYLNQNLIRSLPPELFALQALTVLTLSKLTFLKVSIPCSNCDT